MARGGIKTKEGEKLDEVTIQNVIDLLEKELKPITKKEACGMLRIAYNTSRLGKIIDSHKEQQATVTRLKAKKRGKPASDIEISNIIEDYVKGSSLTEIAKSLFRSSSFVKGVIERFNVPKRSSSADYFRPELLPDEALSETFNPDEVVWSAKYNTVALIDKQVQLHPIHGNCYRIWVKGARARYAVQPWYELGKLSHLNNLGVKI